MNDETKQQEGATQQGQAGERSYALQRMYLKDVSFESPNSPHIFLEEWKPQINMNLGANSRKVDDDTYEVVLTITVDAKQDEKTAFLIELQQAGIFHASGFNPDELHHLLGVHCPQNLFPFAREAIYSLAMKGGFPQVMVQPINFDALYRKNLEEQAAGGKA